MKKKNIILLIFIIAVLIFMTTVILVYFKAKRVQEDNRQYEIQTITQYNYFVVREENRYGVIDTKGDKIIDTKYEDVKIPNPEKDVFICYENNDIIVLNENGEEIFSEYEKIEPLRLKNVSSDLMYEKSVLKYCNDEKYGIIDFSGRQITKPIYEEIDTLQFKEGELLVKKEGKFGVINIKGAVLVKTSYDKIETDKFYEEGKGYKNSGYIVSQKTDEGYRYGYVSLEGKEVTDTIYNDLHRITDIDSEDIYLNCAENGKYGILRNGKKIVENEYQSIVYNESNNTLIALKGKKYGIVSIDGKVIVPFEYDQINITGEYIYAKIDDVTTIFDSEGKEANIDEDLAIINIKDTDYKIYIQTVNGNTTYSIYKKGVEMTKNEYTYIQYLYDNYFIACNIEGKLGIINENDKAQVQFNYNSIQIIENTNMIQTLNNETAITEIYSNNMKRIADLENAVIENNKDYIKFYNNDEIKYISKSSEREVENTDIFFENKIFVDKLGTNWGFVDSAGNKVVDYIYEKVTEVNKFGFAGIKQNDKWGVINSIGEIVVEPKYKLNDSEPVFIGEYYKVIYGNGEIYYTK